MKKISTIYFYHTDGRFLGSAIAGPAADRYEDQLMALYGKHSVRREIKTVII